MTAVRTRRARARPVVGTTAAAKRVAPPSVAVRFDVPARALPLPAAKLRTQIAAAVALAGFPGRLSVAVVDDAAMRVLNRDFHGCDEPTDVLAFALGGGPGSGTDESFDAEVVVSLDTARLEADERGVSLAAELLLYVVHGTLHLMGEDDHDRAAYRRMHARALSILAALGHSNTIDDARVKLGPETGAPARRKSRQARSP